MKRLFLGVIFLVFIVILTGCDSRVYWDGKLKSIDQAQEANMILEDIINALENDDTEALKNVFAIEVQNSTSDLDSQIEEAIEYFEGEVISYDSVGTPAGSESMREGELVYSSIGNAKSKSVVTTEDTYTISFSAILVDDEETNQGVWRIWLGKNKEDYMILGVVTGMPKA